MKLTRPDQFDQLCQWMECKQYLTSNDFYDSSYNDPEKFDTKGPATEYKWKGKMNHLPPNVAQKLKGFVRWMTHEDRPYELHDDFLATLTRDNYLKFRHMDSQSSSASSPFNHEPYKLKISFSGESKAKSTPAPQQVHQHSQDEPTEEPTPDTSTQTLVNKCLAESGIDPTDIQNVMPVSYAKRNFSSHESSRQIQTHQRYIFARVNQSKHHNCDDLDPTDTPSAVPTAPQAPSDDTYNPNCTHSLMETQCNHSQYPILMKQNSYSYFYLHSSLGNSSVLFSPMSSSGNYSLCLSSQPCNTLLGHPSNDVQYVPSLCGSFFYCFPFTTAALTSSGFLITILGTNKTELPAFKTLSKMIHL